MNKKDVFDGIIDLIRNGDKETFDFCKGIVDIVNGDNNHYMDSNGEVFFAKELLRIRK